MRESPRTDLGGPSNGDESRVARVRCVRRGTRKGGKRPRRRARRAWQRAGSKPRLSEIAPTRDFPRDHRIGRDTPTTLGSNSIPTRERRHFRLRHTIVSRQKHRNKNRHFVGESGKAQRLLISSRRRSPFSPRDTPITLSPPHTSSRWPIRSSASCTSRTACSTLARACSWWCARCSSVSASRRLEGRCRTPRLHAIGRGEFIGAMFMVMPDSYMQGFDKSRAPA